MDKDLTVMEQNEELLPVETPPETPKPKKTKRVPVIILCVIVAFLLLLGAAVFYASMPVTVEIGEEATIPALENIPPLAYICHVETDLSAIDTRALGEYELAMSFFGFIPYTTALRVCDTVAPVLEVRDLKIKSGYELTPEDFVVSVTDATAVTLEFDAHLDTTKDGMSILKVADEGGNVTCREVRFTVVPELSSCVYELGLSLRKIEVEVLKLHAFDALDTHAVDIDACGVYPVYAEHEGETYLFSLEIRDTTAPKATARSYDLLLGQKLSIDDFVDEIVDESDVELSYMLEPDFNALGQQNVVVRLTDAWGNTSDVDAKLQIHNIEPTLKFEIGTPTYSFHAHVKRMFGDDSVGLKFEEDFTIDDLAIGTYNTKLAGEFSEITLEIRIVDTVAPRIELREMTIYTGESLEAEDFVESCIDRSKVTYRFAKSIDTSHEGTHTLSIIATDAAGNKTTAETTLYVVKDRKPPVIYGVKNLSAYEGDSVSYRQGVYAMDERDGKVTVKVDASKVKTSVVGTYAVTYTATDSDGNIAKKTAYVTINPINMTAVNRCADEVLSEIVKSTMTEKQKARAIYDWCVKNIKYSTATSHLMGYYAKAAYSGFQLHYGNCYTYYAVSSALLSRAGIENRIIQRNDLNNPHYWCLVKIGGSWYHFDTCPQPAPHKLEVFLLTDKQLAAFTKEGYYSFDSSKYPATPK